MKKNLLLTLGLAASIAANAQIASVDTTLASGGQTLSQYTTVITLKTEKGTFDIQTACDQEKYSVKGANSPKVNNENYDLITFNGTTVNAKAAIQGSNNPTQANGSGFAGNLEMWKYTKKDGVVVDSVKLPKTEPGVPTTGCAYTFTAPTPDGAQKNQTLIGYFYVIHKASANKAYVVLDNKKAIGYTFVQATDGTKVPAKYQWDLNPVDEDGYFTDPFIKQACEYITEGDYKGKSGDGLGVIKFPIYAGDTYLFGASGSKMTLAAVAFSEKDDANITISQSKNAAEPVALLGKAEQADGIETVETVTNNSSAVLYNLAGQKVSKDYKGVVVANGKKFIQK